MGCIYSPLPIWGREKCVQIGWHSLKPADWSTGNSLWGGFFSIIQCWWRGPHTGHVFWVKSTFFLTKRGQRRDVSQALRWLTPRRSIHKGTPHPTRKLSPLDGQREFAGVNLLRLKIADAAFYEDAKSLNWKWQDAWTPRALHAINNWVSRHVENRCFPQKRKWAKEAKADKVRRRHIETLNWIKRSKTSNDRKDWLAFMGGDRCSQRAGPLVDEDKGATTHLRLCLRSLLSPRRSRLGLSPSRLRLFLSRLRLREPERRWCRFSLSRSAGPQKRMDGESR